MKTTAYIATSLDGYIARENGGIDWLPDANEDYGFGDFLESVDAIIMGRNTYELVLSFGSWPYGKMPVIVLSSAGVVIPSELSGTIAAMSATPAEVVRRQVDLGRYHLYIDGGNTIQRFLRVGLIDRLIITTVPILIGSGISLFGELAGDVQLRHVETRNFSGGMVQTEYEVLTKSVAAR